MSAIPIAAYLADFGGRRGSAKGDRKGADGPPSPAEEAYARGLAAGRDAATAEWGERLEQERRAHEEKRAEERSAWLEEQASALASSLTTGLQDLERRIADSTGRILAPFIASELRVKAVANLCTELDILLRKDGGIALSISGPDDLLERLREKIGDRAESVAFEAGAGPDVRVEAGETLLETRLGAWLERLRGVLP
jgi:hypothetical protein